MLKVLPVEPAHSLIGREIVPGMAGVAALTVIVIILDVDAEQTPLVLVCLQVILSPFTKVVVIYVIAVCPLIALPFLFHS